MRLKDLNDALNPKPYKPKTLNLAFKAYPRDQDGACGYRRPLCVAGRGGRRGAGRVGTYVFQAFLRAHARTRERHFINLLVSCKIGSKC